MNKITVRCWNLIEECGGGERVEIYFTIPDFGDAHRLFTCLTCGAIFAVDPDREYYSGISFDDLRATLVCPVCETTLKIAVPYPETFSCPQTREVGHHVVDTKIPPDEDSVTRDFWDPYSTLTGEQ